MPRTLTASLVAVLLTATVLTSCDYRLDTQRHPEARGTLGQEIYRILKKDLDRYQPAEGQALGAWQQPFVRAVDGLLPAASLSAVQAFFVAVLELYDQQAIQRVLRPAACSLAQELAADDELLQAAWYLRRPEGYGADGVLLELLKRLALRDDAADLLAELAGLWLAHDGLDAEFRPSEEDATFAELLADLSLWLTGRQPQPADPRSGFAVWRDWLLSEDPRLVAGSPGPEYLVRVDQRGRAMVAPDPQSGRIPEPFVDRDQDGLADVDPQSGDYLDPTDQPLAVPAPFAPDGQRPRVDGRLLYRYSDLTASPLAALLAQLEPLVADGLLWDLPDTLPALLGPQVAQADEDGLYVGYDPGRSALVALGHALLAVADYDRLPQLLEALLTVAELHEPQLARLLHEAERVGEVIDRYPDVSLRAHNRLLDDLLPHLLVMARRGYLLRILQSFGDPGWRQLGPGLVEMLAYRSVVPAGWDHYDGYDTYEHYLQVRKPMDFSAPDTIYDNRSNLQRGVHLIHDTNQVRHSVSVAGWEPFPIEDMLAFYLDSTAGLIQVEWYVAAAVLEFSDETPTTEEINRFMVDDHDILGNPVGREGFEIRKYNGEALMAMEFSGLLAGLRPMWSTVVQLDRDQDPSGTRVLADLLAAVHPHYSCDLLPDAAEACADIRPLEPMLLEVLQSTEIADALVDLLASLQGLETGSGYRVLDELDRFVGHLLEPDPDLVGPDGSGSVPAADGLTPVYPVSRFYLLLDALRRMDQAVEAEPAAEAAFERAADLIWDRFLQVEPAAGGWRMQNRQAWTLLLDLLDQLGRRARAHLEASDLAAELADFEVDLRQTVSGRVLPRLVAAWKLVAGHPSLPARLDALALDLLDQSDPSRAREARRLAAWGLQHLQVDRAVVPIGRTLGQRLDPAAQGWRFEPQSGCVPIPAELEPQVNLRWISRALWLLGRLLDIRVVDEQGASHRMTAELLANAVTAYPGQTAYPLDDLLQVIAAVHRSDPLAAGELSAQDLGHILHQVADFLLDDERGVEKLYQMIDRRDGF